MLAAQSAPASSVEPPCPPSPHVEAGWPAQSSRGTPLLELLYQALSQDRGLVVEAEDCDVEELRQRLYRERKKAQDPDLDILSFVPSPTDPNQLWIVRKDALHEPGTSTGTVGQAKADGGD